MRTRAGKGICEFHCVDFGIWKIRLRSIVSQKVGVEFRARHYDAYQLGDSIEAGERAAFPRFTWYLNAHFGEGGYVAAGRYAFEPKFYVIPLDGVPKDLIDVRNHVAARCSSGRRA